MSKTPTQAPPAPRTSSANLKEAQTPPPAAAATPAPPEEAEGEEETPGPATGRFVIFNAVPSWAVSSMVHFVLFIILALMQVPERKKDEVTTISSTPTEMLEQIDEFKTEKIELNLDETAVSTDTSQAIQNLTSNIIEVTETSVAAEVDPAQVTVELSDFGEEVAPKQGLLNQIGNFNGTGTAGRSAAMRAQMLSSGGNADSERAVARALEWFARHQLPDGGWNFDHRLGQCNGRCTQAGTLSACRTGATAMALLPFLGAGQTHREGKYKETVNRGLYFLAHQMKQRNIPGLGMTGDLAQGGGNMYSHGLAAIVLCEAYAMTQDKGLAGPAQLSLNHIMYAQDPVGGGWRYTPRQPGDTSVVGWQLMALKSGHMGYLKVDPRTIQGATRFLDAVQADGGAKYGYTDPGGGQATTAVGLLCRMYLGWKKDHPALKRGVDQLSAWGPSGPGQRNSANMYYNYYATQVMRHYEGETWDKWNNSMRDYLVNSQEADEKQHDLGSWHMEGDHGAESGGRIYCTSLATMILEVYYRHMPLYAKQASEDEFPLR